MSHFALVWKARTVEKCRQKYKNEKFISMNLSNKLPKKTLMHEWSQNALSILKRRFLKWWPEGSSVHNFYVYLKKDQSILNCLFKSVIGFFIGIILTYLCFMFFVFQLTISLVTATILSSIIGVLLTLGLAYSYRVRCLFFLLIPQCFSRVGRYTVTCYALILILTGPATNTLKNSGILSKSLSYGQEDIQSNKRQLMDSMHKPINIFKDSIYLIMSKAQKVAERMKEVELKLNRLILSIAEILQASSKWLRSKVPYCNKSLGTPYQRCIRAVDQYIENKETYKHKGNTICLPMHSFEKFCEIDFFNTNLAGAVKKRVRKFSERVRTLFFIEVNVHSYVVNMSSTEGQISAGLVTEIRHRADPLLTWLSCSNTVASFCLFLIIYRAKHYQHMYETRYRFDNRYITKELRDLDLKRLRQNRETVLPLNRRERAKFISTTSFRLLPTEKVFLSRSAVFMIITTFKLLIHMVADYSLYWVLMMIRHHGSMQTPLQHASPTPGPEILGSGFVAKLLQSVIEAFSAPLIPPVQSPVSCLPNPHPPDFKRYSQIGVLIAFLWFFALFEPYGLRLRHVIMGHYKPERAKSRALWLYNHIMKTRGSFLKYARRKLHREYKYSKEDDLTFHRWISNHVPSTCLRSLLGLSADEAKCLLCGTRQLYNDPDTQLIRCESRNCPGVYCMNCYSVLGQLCTICMAPQDYGDMSDVSLESGSSDSETNDVNHIDEGNDDDDNDTYNGSCVTRRPNVKKYIKRNNGKQDEFFCSDKTPLLENSDKENEIDGDEQEETIVNFENQDNSNANNNDILKLNAVKETNFKQYDPIKLLEDEFQKKIYNKGTKVHKQSNVFFCFVDYNQLSLPVDNKHYNIDDKDSVLKLSNKNQENNEQPNQHQNKNIVNSTRFTRKHRSGSLKKCFRSYRHKLFEIRSLLLKQLKQYENARINNTRLSFNRLKGRPKRRANKFKKSVFDNHGHVNTIPYKDLVKTQENISNGLVNIPKDSKTKRSVTFKNDVGGKNCNESDQNEQQCPISEGKVSVVNKQENNELLLANDKILKRDNFGNGILDFVSKIFTKLFFSIWKHKLTNVDGSTVEPTSSSRQKRRKRRRRNVKEKRCGKILRILPNCKTSVTSQPRGKADFEGQNNNNTPLFSSGAKNTCEIEINAVKSSCSCATQYSPINTYRDSHRKTKSYPNKQIENSYDSSYITESSHASDYSSEITDSDNADEIYYVDEINKTDDKRNQVNEEKDTANDNKINRSTITDESHVSTVASDWWSPILERKDY